MSSPSTEPSRSPHERLHLRVVDDAEVALAFVCGEDDVELVTVAAERVDIERTRVITASDEGLDELRKAVTCAEVPTLFVVCRTASFDAIKARRAVECFGTRRVLSHRLLVLELDPERPGGWTTTIRRSHAAMRRSLTLTSDAPRDASIVDSGDRDAVQGETRARRMTPPPVTDDGKPLVMVARHAPEAKGGDEDLQSWWRDEVGPIPAHVRTPEPARRRLAVVDPMQTQEDLPASISDADLRQTRDDAAAAETKVNGVVVSPGRLSRIAALALVSAVVLGFAVAPVLGASRGPSVEVPSLAPMTASVAMIDEHVPHAAPVAIVPVAVPLPVRAAPVVEPIVEPVVEVAEPLAAAVTEGRVREHGSLHVVGGPERVVDWYAAANHCRAKSIDGVSDFRLPSLEELRMLRKRDLVPGDAVWSGTRVAGDRAKNWVLEARGTMSAQDKHDGRALVACVRGR